jgi:hypothetical protein
MVVGEWRVSARLRRADLGRRRVGPREERPAGDDEGRDEGERDDERYVSNIFVVEVLLNEVRPARAGDLPDVDGSLVRGHHHAWEKISDSLLQ